MLEGNKQLPVKMFSRGGMVVAALPMPGLEPQDITVVISANNTLRIEGAQRETKQKETSGILLDEWSIGPYHRTLELPSPVDGTTANITYGNGVLVVTMPQSQTTQPATLTLQRLSSTSGQQIGH